LTNLDYYDYLAESQRKSRAGSPIRGTATERGGFYSPSRSTKKDIDAYMTPSKRATSPGRMSMSAKKAESPMKGIEEVHLASALKD